MISVFTPSNNARWLSHLYECLKNQTISNWEWVVLLNHGAFYSNDDKRVKIFYEEGHPSNKVGYLKSLCCAHANGDILVEVDHDDLIPPYCLEKVQAAFDSDPEIGFVYSNTANVDIQQYDWEPVTWDARYGWKYRKIQILDNTVLEAVSAKPYPQSISRIWFAPNHIRAWRREAYREIGGHDMNMKIADDHDLICRTYLSRWKIHHIDECLYVYRIHGKNTWLQNQREIQEAMWRNYNRYMIKMMEKWTRENNLQCIEIGNPGLRDGYVTIDLSKEAGITHNLNMTPWPLYSDSVGLLIANDVIEHLFDPMTLMKEVYRVLAHGGMFCVTVPSTDGRGAFQDPTHKTFWNQNSFWYYTRKEQNDFILQYCPVRFQTIKLITYFPSSWHEENNIPYVEAHMIALKEGGERFYGDIEI